MKEPLSPAVDPAIWHCTDPLPDQRYRALVREMNLRGSKWDTQLGDTAVLAPFALTLPLTEWTRLARLAEALTAELLTLEAELQDRPDLWPCLGLPRWLRTAMQGPAPWTPSAARVMRYDFHPTPDGWKISEVNSDVPGGFNEASTFTQLIAGAFPGYTTAGDPLAALSAALAESAGEAGPVVLLSSPGHPEDYQVTAGIAAALRHQGVSSLLAQPAQVTWRDGIASVGSIRAGCIYRFYQGEWLYRVAPEIRRPFFRSGRTPVCNPGSALLSESKRLPLLWSELSAATPTWRQLLPETTAPFLPGARSAEEWLLKPAFCNTGEAVFGAGLASRGHRRLAQLHALIQPRRWIAQRRFQILPLSTPAGLVYPCIGVYTINGRARGLYGRFSSQPIIDYAASDVAILLHE